MTNLMGQSDRDELHERRLSTHDFELVIRRAAELQTTAGGGVRGDITEAEALRIGRDLGLSIDTMHRALAETAGIGSVEAGVLCRLYGPQTIRAARAVRGESSNIARILEKYLIEREYLAVVRRLTDRVLFTRAAGISATVGRAASRVFNRSPLLRVANLEMVVHPFDGGFSYVSLATSLRGHRTTAAASSLVGGGTGAAAVATVLAIAVAPPAAILALPVLGVGVLGGRAYYQRGVRSVQVQLESLLDRVEHGELPPPRRESSPWRR